MSPVGTSAHQSDVTGHEPDNGTPRRCRFCGAELRWASGFWVAAGGKAMASYCFERARGQA
jgi:hypothetical protein